MTDEAPHIIDGAADASGAEFRSVNPWTQQPQTRAWEAGAEQVERAVASARAAFEDGAWSRRAAEGRREVLYRFAALIEEHRDELGAADTRDMGRPISKTSRTDVDKAAGEIRLFADLACVATTAHYPAQDPSWHVYSDRAPAGVVVAVAPWNVPLRLTAWKIAAPLALGNSVCLKTSEVSPTSGALLGRLAVEAGLPPGTLNVLHGFGRQSTGELLCSSPGIDRISATCSTATGQAIQRLAADQLVPVSLECGGNGAAIVCADADVDKAVAGIVRAVYSNSGQICLATNRVFAHENRVDELVEGLAAAARAQRVGDPMDPSTDVGPVSGRAPFERLSGLLDRLSGQGATLVEGGPMEGTWCVKPSVVRLPADLALPDEETFGPIALVRSVADEEEAAALANQTAYGLSAAVYTEDIGASHRMAERLRSGNVWVNAFGYRDARAPFGGAGLSGVGREGGEDSLRFFTEAKSVMLHL